MTTERRDLDPQEVRGRVAPAVSVTTGMSSDSEASSATIRWNDFWNVVVRIVSASSALMSAVAVGACRDCPLWVNREAKLTPFVVPRAS